MVEDATKHTPPTEAVAGHHGRCGRANWFSRQQGRYEFSGHRGIETRSVSHELATPDTISGSVATLHAEHYVQDLVDPVEMPTCRVAAIVDMADREAVCVALLFKEMLVHLLLNSWEQVPSSFLKIVMYPPMSMWC